MNYFLLNKHKETQYTNFDMNLKNNKMVEKHTCVALTLLSQSTSPHDALDLLKSSLFNSLNGSLYNSWSAPKILYKRLVKEL